MIIRDEITSLKNPKIKNIGHLQKSKERKAQNLFIIEGQKEVARAVISGYSPVQVFFCEELAEDFDINGLFENTEAEIFPVTNDVFQKIAVRESSGGIVCLAEPRSHSLADLKLKEKPLLLVLEAVEKPGNLGAILRTADAAGIDGVIICDPQTDIYNPNVVRSSLGCLFSVPLAVSTSDDTIKWLKQMGITIYTTYLEASHPYHQVDYSNGSAIVLGTESTGISPIWVINSDKNIIVPMKGIADSLNVSTTAAIVAFEACRQRGF